jgi:hypothetical protein
MLPNKAVQASQKVSENLGILAERTANRAIPDLSTIGQQEAGGVIRVLAANLSTEVGNAASVAAVESYKNLTDEALTALYESTPWGSARGAIDAERTARFLARARSYDGLSFQELDAMVKKAVGAKGQGQVDGALLQARMWAKNGFQGVAPQTINVARSVEKRLEGVIGNAMTKYANGSFLEAENALSMGVNRMVQDVYRETMVFNTERDPFSTGYQRVASANACAFCLVVALNEYTTFEESGGYHDHCNCSTTPIYRGVQPFTPEYYSTFKEEYDLAFIKADGVTAEDVLASVRNITGRK